jgi:DNA (cytosine-5)-methyltransferase 3A
MRKNGITVLSLFDGMSCGQIALKKLGIKVIKYYASEIDKHAIKVTQHNFPDTIQLGDITQWKEWQLDWSKIDLILAGSPCQGFSFAGKQLAFDDPRSKLFFVFVEILNHCKKFNPDVKFLLENVKMKKEYELVITRYMGVAPIEINSALVSAQNRVRNYWTNIANEPYGLFGDMQCVIPQPEDRGIVLKDILEKDVPEKYYIKSEAILKFVTDEWRQYKSYTQINGHKSLPLLARTYSNWCGDYVYRSGQLAIDNSTTLIVASRGRNPENPKSRESGLNTEQMLEPQFDGKTNFLTSVQKNNLVFTKNYLQYDVSGKGYKSQQDRAFYENGKHGCLSTARADTKTGVIENGKIRRLTPTECKRLQTVPDWYDMSMVSDTQQYKMLGNGWSIDVIVHILSYLPLPHERN